MLGGVEERRLVTPSVRVESKSAIRPAFHLSWRGDCLSWQKTEMLYTLGRTFIPTFLQELWLIYLPDGVTIRSSCTL
ncbi:hypothetical protein HKBW3S25_00809 [Candidatus Hakubella thermalkaliphila]|uniref:Uncharacterized protein n=1 Tax=Candidatus Hakubella thermalkaliphila TaxID=2754717 RepID=A0A6V8NYQ3_9ACTN|nr:hypothetical protein HKBW3S25_00809 [Candidatus Hakubella thermalkaliphila]